MSAKNENEPKEEDHINNDVPNLYPSFIELMTGKKPDPNSPPLPPNPSFWTVIKCVNAYLF